MPRRTPPERVVVSMCVNGNGASRAIYESVAYIPLQPRAVSLTESLWAWQAHEVDKSARKRYNWIPTGRSRRSQRGNKKSCSKLVETGGMLCKLHCKHDERTLLKGVSRQGNRTENNTAPGPGSVGSYIETTGETACFNFRGKKFEAKRIAANKSKWEDVLSKFCAEYPHVEKYA